MPEDAGTVSRYGWFFTAIGGREVVKGAVEGWWILKQEAVVGVGRGMSDGISPPFSVIHRLSEAVPG